MRLKKILLTANAHLMRAVRVLNTHVLYPVLGASLTAVLTHLAQGAPVAPNVLMYDAIAAAAGVLLVMLHAKGGKDQPWFAHE